MTCCTNGYIADQGNEYCECERGRLREAVDNYVIQQFGMPNVRDYHVAMWATRRERNEARESSDVVYQIRVDNDMQWWEVSEEMADRMVNKCGWQGRVLFTKPQ